MNSELKKIPYLGLGIGLRREIAAETLKHKAEIDVLEIIAEQFFSKRTTSLPFLERFRAEFPINPHGIKLSIGSTVPLKDSTLTEMRMLVDRLQAPYYSDHFALTGHSEILEIGHLSPLWFTREMLQHVIRRVDAIQQYIGVPLVLENITAPFIIGEADMEEPEFISEVCRKTQCCMLLDVTNVYINCYNEKSDPLAELARYPLDHVVHVHLAGGEIGTEGQFHDTHSREINGPNEGIWPLLEFAAKNTNLKTLTIERDDDFGTDFDAMMLVDLARARSIVETARKSA